MRAATREAFERRDSVSSRREHERAEELHATAGAGELVKSLVFGGLDGVITTFAIVAAVEGARLPTSTVILMGVANLVADGISMGLGDYLSEVAEERFVRHEFEREMWEMENYPEGEIQEMIQIYVEKKGLSRDDATSVMRTLAKYPRVFVDLMCVDELGFVPPNDDGLPAWKKGLVTMLAFDVFGAIPIFVYYVASCVHYDATHDKLFAVSAVATASTMFALGVCKASLTCQPKLWSGLMMLVNGTLAAIVAYGIGHALEGGYSAVANNNATWPSSSSSSLLTSTSSSSLSSSLSSPDL
ncbi:hypothetical protein CTAYLR_010117 [Chrysophaeum taylorii]|uniref:Vacuolar iron transporter n=1 Tax=Chrysophaeum taylorii TaxID=2483200 RepID=A0AAD7UH07_9STRA|nr:hypothetical protein CTAYLR_010117 [Chrysophaeum taylorii]